MSQRATVDKETDLEGLSRLLVIGDIHGKVGSYLKLLNHCNDPDDADQITVEAHEQFLKSWISIRDAFGDGIDSRLHAIAMNVGGADEIDLDDDYETPADDRLPGPFKQREWLSAETVSHASDWKRDGRIFSVSHGGKEYFPRYEFDAFFQPLPVIQDILQAFGPVDPWKIAAWFHLPQWLDR